MKIRSQARKFVVNRVPRQTPEWISRGYTLFFILSLIIVFGGLALVPTIASAIQEEKWISLLVLIGAYAGILIILFKKKLSYYVRSYVLCIAVVITGYVSISSIGFVSSARLWFLCSAVLACLLIGGKSAFAVFLISFIVFVGFGYHTDFAIRLPSEPNHVVWIITSTTFVFVNILVVGATYLIVSGLKKAEASLRESEETHRALVDGLPDIVMRFDRGGRHLFVSDNVREIADKEATQFIGKTHAELGFPEAQCRFWAEAIQRVFDSGAPFETEFSLEGKVGAATFNWRLIPERDAQGAVSSVLSISRDITGHRKTEQQYKTLFREMSDGFALHEIVRDAEGAVVDYRFLAVNPAFERMTGLKAEAIVGRTVLGVFPDMERHWIATYGKVAQSGGPVLFDNRAGGSGKHFEVTGFRPFAGQFACIFQDITERKRAEEEREKLQAQLTQARKMESVGRLAGGVAHDFNNMLSVITGNAELAMENMTPNDPLQKNISEIFSAARRSTDITRQLLAFARKQTIAPAVLDLNRTIKSMLNMLRRLIGEDIELAWLPGANIWPVKMDPSQIDQVLANLCINARDAIADVGKISIETGTATFDSDYCAEHQGFVPGDFVLLAVSDNGCGMDQDTLANLFEPFFTTKDVDKGTGLGLATVYGIVKQNDGFINVYSEPGQGTTFKIYLPRHLAETGRPAKKVSDKTNLVGTETILLVEDEPSILRMTRMMLESNGYKVLVAGTPGEAIALAREHTGEIHLLITDVVMPEMNGRDLAGNLLSLYPNLKRLFMSGYTANVIAHHGILDDGVLFIQKPFAKQDLAIKVRKVLDEPNQTTQQ